MIQGLIIEAIRVSVASALAPSRVEPAPSHRLYLASSKFWLVGAELVALAPQILEPGAMAKLQL